MNKHFYRFGCLLFVCLILLSTMVSCAETPQSKEEKGSVIFGWKGEFSERWREWTIIRYQNNYTPLLYEAYSDTGVFTFEVDFEVQSASVPLLSRVSSNDVDDEMHGYVDMMPDVSTSGNSVTVNISQVTIDENTGVWSYLVKVTDTEKVTRYYYFRMDYTKTK